MVLKTVTRLILLLLLYTEAIPAESESLLHHDDVKRVMNLIFSQHVEKKEISGAIIKHSLRIYINQFDQQKIYLLENEVSPFLKLNNAELDQLVQQYKDNDFSIYNQLNKTIQMSIKRAQENRASWIDRPNEFLKQAFKEARQKRSFASTLNELNERQNQAMFDYTKKGQTWTQKLQLMREYDDNLRAFENQYLFMETDNIAMVDPKKESVQTLHIIKALAKSLDAHTSFFNPNEAYDMRMRLEKGFDGVGLIVSKSNLGFKVIKIIPKSSAEASKKIALNDYLVKIDGQDIKDKNLSDVMRMLRGKNGTTVSLQLQRPDQQGNSQTINLSLKREPITIEDGRVETNFARYQDGIIGCIKLPLFYQGANDISSERDVRNAINNLQKKGKLKGLILDLRGNSGGFLTQAVKVAGLFITNGVIVVSKYSNGEEKFYRDMDGKTSYEGPLVVLTSRTTASAAEIVAQALQDYGVALIVGDEQTYGKGTIQNQTVTNEDNNSNSFFKVTVGKYYTVSGKTPQIQGVKADIVVPSPHSLEHIGEEYLDHPLNQDYIPDSFVDSLNDIDPGLRPWYLRYYMPTLQKKNLMLADMVPLLKKNSQKRMASSHYKDFLQLNEKESSMVHKKSNSDPQLYEAINIIKDMISIENKSQNTSRLGVTEPIGTKMK